MYPTKLQPKGLAKGYSAKNVKVPVNFFHLAPDAQSVCVIGDFNNWQPDVNPMTRQPDGSWRVQLMLNHGHHMYQFLVDGAPMLDPRAQGVTRNIRNERSSLIAVS
ncbi:MAG TPA: isoamylase early set domain-containing protein [Verrucomicrobiae bacterium]|nr:isoamylase early set domain-containing protein [Verrucomicrobiae bacterium]